MKYQVIYKYKCDVTPTWYTEFFDSEKVARSIYNLKKEAAEIYKDVHLIKMMNEPKEVKWAVQELAG